MRYLVLILLLAAGCRGPEHLFVRDLVCVEGPNVQGEPGPCPPLAVKGCENANGTAVYAYHESEDIAAPCLAAVLE